MREDMINIRRFYRFLGFLSAWLVFGSPLVWAQISVNDAILHIKAGKRPITNVVVHNNSDAVVYVVSQAQIVLNPGAEGEEQREMADNLLLSPKKFSLGPQGERTVRILLKKMPIEREEVYRVAFVPQDRRFDKEAEDTQGSYVGSAAQLRIMTGMGVLLFVDPLKPKVDVSWRREGKEVIFKNDGNMHASLITPAACVKGEGAREETCTSLRGGRLYSGREIRLEVPENAVLKLGIRNGSTEEIRSLTVPIGNGQAKVFEEWAREGKE